jgi:hypothetical protein
MHDCWMEEMCLHLRGTNLSNASERSDCANQISVRQQIVHKDQHQEFPENVFSVAERLSIRSD